MMISVALCWSTMGVAFKFIDWDPLVIAAVRNLLTFLFLAAYRRSLKISFKKDVIVGAFIAYLTQTAFTYANKYTSAAKNQNKGHCAVAHYDRRYSTVLFG